MGSAIALRDDFDGSGLRRLAKAVQPGFQVIRRYRRPVLRSLEQAHRSAMDNHVHRATQMGSWVLIVSGGDKLCH